MESLARQQQHDTSLVISTHTYEHPVEAGGQREQRPHQEAPGLRLVGGEAGNRYDRLALDLAGQPGFRDRLEAQWGPSERPTYCPNVLDRAPSKNTGRVRKRCGATDCLYCNGLLRWDIHDACLLSKPTHSIVVSGLVGDFDTDAPMIRHLKRLVRAAGYDIDMVWATEPYPDPSAGYHAQGWSRGPDIPSKVLRRLSERAGLGWASMLRLTSVRDLGYIVKNATWNHRSLAEHRRINDGEIVHGRTFWRDHRNDDRLTQRKASARCAATPRPAQEAWYRDISGTSS